MLKKMSIRLRLILGFSAVGLLMILLVVITQVKIDEISDKLNHYAVVTIPNANQISQMELAFESKEGNMYKALAATTPDEVDYFLSRAEEDEKLIQKEWEGFYKSTSADPTSLSTYYDQLNETEKIRQEITKLIKANNLEAAFTALRERYTPAKEASLTSLNTIIAGRDSRVAEQAEAAKVAKRQATSQSFLLLLAAFTFAILLAYFIIKSITRPLKEARDVAIEMSKGNLSMPLTYESPDEIGVLADGLRTMIKSINAYITDIDRAMSLMANCNFAVVPSQPFMGDFANIERSITKFIITMTSVLRELKGSATLVADGAQSVSDGSQTLSQGAAEQSQAIDQLSASISEISKHVTLNVKNTKMAKEMADQATNGVTTSNQHMAMLVTAMDDINEKSEQIGKIIKTIEDIAFQTNILALNAAVEAARAGAAGKGFAVVADEVRNLATKSSNAAKDTAHLIESSIESVHRGAKLVNQTAEGMLSIVESSNATTQLIAEVTAASDEQATAISQVSDGIAQITSVVLTNSATSEESAAASEELSAQASIMMGLVSRFQLLQDLPEQTDVRQNNDTSDNKDRHKTSIPSSPRHYEGGSGKY